MALTTAGGVEGPACRLVAPEEGEEEPHGAEREYKEYGETDRREPALPPPVTGHNEFLPVLSCGPGLWSRFGSDSSAERR